ncbi:MAG: ROK family protein [Thermoleophilaceae bacterium]
MSRRQVIGVDAGGTKLLAGVVDHTLAVSHTVRHVWAHRGRAETVTAMVEAVKKLHEAASAASAVGFGIPSLVDHPTGISRWSNHLALDDFDFAAEVSDRIGLPVVVDNDASAAVLAEHRFGAAKGADHAALVALGTGIGGGLVLGGQVYRGAHGFAGEIGHMVVDHEGEECPGDCPGRGCLEALASGRAIGRAGERAAAAAPDSELGRHLSEHGTVPGDLVTELALAGDAGSRAVLAEIGRRLGAGITGLVNLLDLEVVVVGGGAAAAGDLLLDPARAVVAARALPPVAERVRIVPAAFGEEAGMLGAALLAMDA